MKEEILKNLSCELQRQQENIELIASENFVSPDILRLTGSILTNKYAEGYPAKRYYNGCDYVDKIEQLAIEAFKELYNVKFVNVQPHSGSSANLAVYRALLANGDTVLGMNLNDGGHLTHGHPLNFSGQDYQIISYSVNNETGLIDYEEVRRLALKYCPKMIIGGASAYSRKIDFRKFREIADESGALLFVDMAHIAGLVAASLHENPCDYADVITSTTHKTLRGPRGGIILTNSEEVINKINKTVFPGTQGGPLMHVIAAKAMAAVEALEPSFKEYQSNVIKNAKALSETLIEEGFHIISGGTDNHLLLVDVKKSCGLTGKEAANYLDGIHITCNKNMVPGDLESAFKTSGIRLGSAAMTTRGLKEEDFKQIGRMISKCLKNYDNNAILDSLQEEVKALTDKYPLYEGMII